MNAIKELSRLSVRDLPERGFGAVLIGEEEESLVRQVLRSKRLFRYAYDLPPEGQGIMCSTLEKEACELFGTRFALAVTSGTAALETSLMALGIGPGDEVIVPAWSWISCFTAVVRVGGKPVLAEINETLCLAPGEISRLATPRTKAVIIVHFQGVAAEMNLLLQEAQNHGIKVIEDGAESPGALYEGARVGSIGDIGVFSFQMNKTITSGEGGLIVSSDGALYERLVRAHDLGLYRAYHQTISPGKLPQFCGSQFRMNELTGAVALAQFRKLDFIRITLRKIQARILGQIGDLELLQFRRVPDPNGDSGIEIYFFLPTPESANAFGAELAKHNLSTVRTTGTAGHYSREYAQKGLTHAAQVTLHGPGVVSPPGYRAQDFPRTEDLINRMIAIPMSVLFTEPDADYIAHAIREAYGVACAGPGQRAIC